MKLRLKTTADVRRALARVANMTLAGEIEPKQANAVIYAANSVLNSIRLDEQAEKMRELERLFGEWEEKNG